MSFSSSYGALGSSLQEREATAVAELEQIIANYTRISYFDSLEGRLTKASRMRDAWI
jgi:hypothetical protein